MRVFLFFFCFIFSVTIKSQHYTSKWYTVDNGLPQSSIKDIVKDKYGFIWLTTEKGIIRYDGNEFLHQNNVGLENMHFRDFQGSIKEDKIYAVNDQEENAIVINKRKATLVSNTFSKNFKRENNLIYKRLLKNIKNVDFTTAYDFYTVNTSLGEYHFGKNILQFIPSKENKVKKNLIKISHDILSNLFVHENHVFIGDVKNRQTIVLYNDKTYIIEGESLYNNPNSRIFWNEITNQVFVINKGNIYISQFKNNQLQLKLLITYPDFEKELYYSMFYDEEYNKLYLGTFTKGLNVVTISNFRVALRNKPFDDNVFYSAIPFGNNSVITSEGTTYFNNSTKTIFNESTLEKITLIYDNSGNILYLKNNSIYKRFKNTGYNNTKILTYKNISLLYIFNTEGIFTASVTNYLSNYLYFFKNDDLSQVKNKIAFKSNILSVVKSGNNHLYVGCRDGLYLVSISKKKIIRKIIDNVIVRQVLKTMDGNIWFTTTNQGFYLIKKNQAVRIPEDKNNFLSQAHYFLEDNKSNLWITSNEGLFKVNKNALLNYAINKNTKVSYYRFTKEYGFYTNEFNGGCNIPGNILNDGQFVFPSLEGLIFFKPNEVKTYYPKSSQIFIESGINGKNKISFSNKFSIKSNYENLVINVDIPYYYNKDNINLQASLVSETDQNVLWKKIPDNKKYLLPNYLKPGIYNLSFRFLIGENGKYAYKNITIEILPFFYQTTWFKIIVLLFSILIILIIAYRYITLNNQLTEKSNNLENATNQLKNQSYYQKELLSSISHDITTPLKFITNLSQKLHESDNLETQREYFESISKSSEQLYKFSIELTKYSQLFSEENVNNEEEYSLYDIIETKKLLFEEIALQKGIFIKNESNLTLKSTINKNILGAILHNLIDNAVKYTSTGFIVIKSYELETDVEIEILDTGICMTNEQIKYYSQICSNKDANIGVYKNYGLGLHMVIQLIKKINGKIYFKKNTPKGMAILITLTK